MWQSLEGEAAVVVQLWFESKQDNTHILWAETPGFWEPQYTLCDSRHLTAHTVLMNVIHFQTFLTLFKIAHLIQI